MYKLNTIPLNDGFFCDDAGMAWFVSATTNELFVLNFKTSRLELCGKIPENGNCFRNNPKCFKKNNGIICIPDRGKKIWHYDLNEKKWGAIWEDALSQRLCMDFLNEIDGDSYVYSKESQSILTINASYEVETCICLNTLDKGALELENVLNERIVLLSRAETVVIVLDYISGNNIIIDLKNKVDSLFSCYLEDEILWGVGFTSLFCYDISRDILEEYEFPNQISCYLYDDKVMNQFRTTKESCFCDVVTVGGKAWFIPKYSNMLVYIWKNKVKRFELPNEEENIISLNYRILRQKYIVEYVKNDRFLGLYSSRNEWIVEIDTILMVCEIKIFSTTNHNLQERLQKNYRQRELFMSHESGAFDLKKYLLI